MVYNFGAGPAMIPSEVMHQVHAEWFDWQNMGLSIVELGHRTPEFKALMTQAEADLREIMAIPDSHHVLFLGGPARTQFAAVPLNLRADDRQGGYWTTGLWSTLALKEAQKLGRAYCVASAEVSGFTQIPQASEWNLQDKTAYLYYTSNETVNGLRFAEVPKLGSNIPLVADMTSSFLSESLNIDDFGLIFAGAQKNIAPAGLTLVIVRKELLNTVPHPLLPSILDYRIQAANHSLYATPPTFCCYMAAKMFEWIKAQGGVKVLEAHNRQKASRLYDFIDQSSMYYCAVDKPVRSLMNVCFRIRDEHLEDRFVEQARAAGLYALKGHIQVGGLRASIYNAMPMAGVEALLNFMADFEKAEQR